MEYQYSYGCMAQSLTVGGKETADMSEEEIKKHIIRLLQERSAAMACLQEFLGNLIEQIADNVNISDVCDECGDRVYTYKLII